MDGWGRGCTAMSKGKRRGRWRERRRRGGRQGCFDSCGSSQLARLIRASPGLISRPHLGKLTQRCVTGLGMSPGFLGLTQSQDTRIISLCCFNYRSYTSKQRSAGFRRARVARIRCEISQGNMRSINKLNYMEIDS